MIKTVMLLLFVASQAVASLSVSLSAFESSIDDPRFKQNNILTKSINVGFNKTINDWYFGLSTNRLLNHQNKTIVYNSRGTQLTSQSLTAIDSLSFGRVYQRYLPTIVLANVNSKTSLFYKGNHISTEKRDAVVYGVNVAYLVDRHLSLGLSFIAPSKPLNLEWATGINLNYNF